MFKIVYDDDDGDTGRVCLIYSYFFITESLLYLSAGFPLLYSAQ